MLKARLVLSRFVKVGTRTLSTVLRRYLVVLLIVSRDFIYTRLYTATSAEVARSIGERVRGTKINSTSIPLLPFRINMFFPRKTVAVIELERLRFDVNYTMSNRINNVPL